MARLHRAAPARGGLRRRARENRRARLLERLHGGEGQLLRVRQPPQARELRGQLPVLDDEPLEFAIEEETNLTERVEVLFLRELHHPMRI